MGSAFFGKWPGLMWGIEGGFYLFLSGKTFLMEDGGYHASLSLMYIHRLNNKACIIDRL